MEASKDIPLKLMLEKDIFIRYNGTNVWQYDVNDTPAQTWKIVSSGNNSYYIINKKSGLYLDVDNAYADSGTNVKIFDRNDAYDAQKWYFIKITCLRKSS